jgi:hypothetical protein
MGKTKKGQSVRIIVTSRQGELAKTLSSLRKRGMKVDSVLDSIGVITGEIAESKLSSVEKTAGVTVEREQRVQLPPPDAPVQ